MCWATILPRSVHGLPLLAVTFAPKASYRAFEVPLKSLFDAVTRARLLAQKEAELETLREELHAARAENERMRAGMRRCVTCEYRIEVRSGRSEHKLLRRADDDDTGGD